VIQVRNRADGEVEVEVERVCKSLLSGKDPFCLVFMKHSSGYRSVVFREAFHVVTNMQMMRNVAGGRFNFKSGPKVSSWSLESRSV
jgi:hypothetical protein